MSFPSGQKLYLRDSQQRSIGEVRIDRFEGNLIQGTIIPSPAFAAVADVFRRFEEAANSQALAVVDELDKAIAALSLSLATPDGNHQTAIHDVQIWSDGGISFRIPSPDTLNGPPEEDRAGRPVGGPIQTGGELVAYWQSEGLIGTRPEILDSPEHARRLRQQAQKRGVS